MRETCRPNVSDCLTNARPLFGALLVVVLIFILVPLDARAQSRSGATIATVTAVDGSGNAAPGCGGNGSNLTSLLNTYLDTPGFSDVAQNNVGDRRTSYRYCDIQTATGAQGWTGDAVATSQQISAQATVLAPEEIFVEMDDAQSSFDLQTGNIARRISTIRLTRRADKGSSERVAKRLSPATVELAAAGREPGGTGPVGLGDIDRTENLLLALQNGINAGDETGGSGLGFFLNGRVNIIKGDENESERGSDGFGGGFTLGVDKQLDDSAYVGLAAGYTHLRTTYDGSSSKSHLDAVALSAYGAWYPTEEIWVDGSVSTAWLGFDTTNEIVMSDGGPPVPDLQGDTNGVNFGFDIGTGYTFVIQEAEGLSIEPFVRLNVLYTFIDDYRQEGGDNSLNLDINSQENTSVTGSFGVGADYDWSTRYGVISPYLRAAYVHEFNQENDDISASFTALPGSGFKLKANATDSHYGNIGVGVAATLAQGLSEFVDYDAVVGHDNVTIHQITAGIRLEY